MSMNRFEIARKTALRQLLSQPRGSDDECWAWSLDRDAGNYGVILLCPFFFPVHRLSYQHFKGDIPRGYVVMHSCDYPPCWNPAHLSVGTHSDNMRDMVAKRRHGGQISAWVTGKNVTQAENLRDMVARGRHGRQKASSI